MNEADESTAARDHYTERVGWALAYAARLHAGQSRKGKTESYLSHVLQVTALVVRYGGGEDQMIAGALHDVPEDCGGLPRLDEIGTLFGPVVRRIVADCSDSLTEDADSKAPYRDRKIAHLEHVRDGLDPLTPLVALCDKVANLTDIVDDLAADGDRVFERFNGKAVGTRAYYSAMLALLAPAVPPRAAGDFRALLSDLGAPESPLGEDPVDIFRQRTISLAPGATAL